MIKKLCIRFVLDLSTWMFKTMINIVSFLRKLFCSHRYAFIKREIMMCGFVARHRCIDCGKEKIVRDARDEQTDLFYSGWV